MSDFDALQGSWEQVAFEIDGSGTPQNVYDAASVLTIIAENRFVVRSAEGRLLLEGEFCLNSDPTPKTLNFLDSIGPDAGKTLPISGASKPDAQLTITPGRARQFLLPSRWLMPVSHLCLAMTRMLRRNAGHGSM